MLGYVAIVHIYYIVYSTYSITLRRVGKLKCPKIQIQKHCGESDSAHYHTAGSRTRHIITLRGVGLGAVLAIFGFSE